MGSTQVKGRSAWLMYGLTLVTGGLFGFVWLVLMLRDAGLAVGKRSGWITLSTFLLGGSAVHLMLLVLIISTPLTSTIHRVLILPDILIVLMLLSLEIAFVMIIRNRVYAALSLTPSIKDTISIVVLTFVMFISLLILQRRLNRLAERSRLP